MNGHRNLKERYYLTRELVKLQQMRDELLKAIPLAEKTPYFQRHKKEARKFFLAKAKWISCALEHVNHLLTEAGGGFDD
ncbi:MAG: hypothetical protein IKP64_07495 [Selenomonadaceae bacterium]|nr:hypothetical protein [Selenomonadaceae bacterium]